LDNIKIDLDWDGVDWIHLAVDRDQWRAVANMVMYHLVPLNVWEFVKCWMVSQDKVYWLINSLTYREVSHSWHIWSKQDLWSQRNSRCWRTTLKQHLFLGNGRERAERRPLLGSRFLISKNRRPLLRNGSVNMFPLFEPTIPWFEQAKAVHVLDRAATMIASSLNIQWK
jgi:hypothetical protein